MPRHVFATLVVLAAAVQAAAAQSAPQEQQQQQGATLNPRAHAELLRSDVRAQKIAILTEVMGFTEAEDAAFWPIYREYEGEMAKLGDERGGAAREYARNLEQLSDEVADKLAARALDLESRRQALKGKYYQKVRSAM